jgi:hypothetical protein
VSLLKSRVRGPILCSKPKDFFEGIAFSAVFSPFLMFASAGQLTDTFFLRCPSVLKCNEDVKIKSFVPLVLSVYLVACSTLNPATSKSGDGGGRVGGPATVPAKFACPDGDQTLGEVPGPAELKMLFCGRRAFQETPAGTWSDLYAWTLTPEQDLVRVVLAERDESVTFTADPEMPHQWFIRYQVSFPTEDLHGYAWRPMYERKLVCEGTGCTLQKEQCRLEIPKDPFPRLAAEVKLPPRPSRRNRRKGVIPSKPMVDPVLTRKLLYRALDGDPYAQRLLSEIHNYFSMNTSMATEAIQNVALFRRAQRIGCVRTP